MPVWNAVDDVITKDFQHPFAGYSYWLRRVTVEQNRLLNYLLDPDLSTQRYFTTENAERARVALYPKTAPLKC